MGKISELPINIHNDTFSLLQSLSDPDDTEFSDYDTVFKTILTFASPTVTPGRKIHQLLIELWLSATNAKVAHLIYNTVIQLYNFHKPGDDPLIWDPVEPVEKSAKFFEELLILGKSRPNDYKISQKQENARMILRYFYLIFDHNLKTCDVFSNSLIYKLLYGGRRGADTRNQIIVTTQASIDAEEGETANLILYLCYIDMCLKLESEGNDVYLPDSRKILKIFLSLTPEKKEIFINCYPDGPTKLDFISHAIERLGRVSDKSLTPLKSHDNDAKKLCKYYYNFIARSSDEEYDLILLIQFAAQMIFQKPSDYPLDKVRKKTEEFVQTIKNIAKVEKTHLKEFANLATRIDLAMVYYCGVN